jgi:hypothetical protein
MFSHMNRTLCLVVYLSSLFFGVAGMLAFKATDERWRDGPSPYFAGYDLDWRLHLVDDLHLGVLQTSPGHLPRGG